MPKIRKVRIVNFEYNDGKRLIADELYNFANRDDDDALNVLINLANGGGKSVLVQLMMQPIIPKAKVAGRRIESFFTKPTDHCFVLLEWQKDNSSEKLLTGIAMAARNASGEDENARGMSVKYYTFYSNYTSDHSNYSIVNLPLSNREHGRFIPADFEAVRTIAKRSNGALVYYRDDDNGAWKHKLEEYGLVQNEWRTMEKLNSEEGGFGKFFGDFKTSDQLVDNLLIRTIEDKLGMSNSQEDHSLSTMLLSYARQYAEQQDVLRNKEIYESFVRGMQHLKPQAESLWNANDRLEATIRVLFGLSDALAGEISLLQKEQQHADTKLEQLDTQKHHIEHEQVSAAYYQKKEAFDEANNILEIAGAEKQHLEAQLQDAKLQCTIQECAGYYEKLKAADSEITVLQAEITRREQGDGAGVQLNALKYSAACSVREALAIEEPRLSACREEQSDIAGRCAALEVDRNHAQNAARHARTAYDQLTGKLAGIQEDTDQKVAHLGVDLFRRIDGPYAAEDLDEVQGEIDARRMQAETACADTQKQIDSIDETLAAIPQKLADLYTQITKTQTQVRSAEDAIEEYDRREASIRRICAVYNLDFSLRFTDSIRAYLNSEQHNNSSEQAVLLRKISVSEEEIHAAERGSVHVPNAVIEYLNSTGVPYNTCEKYLLRLVEEQKITPEQCLDILRNYPAAAYGVLMDKEAKERFFSFEREQWLPAMVPIFTHEQMKLILEQNRPFSGSIAFYSEASFADRTNYISLLHRQKEQFVQQHVRLLAGASQLRLQIADAESFTYAESWKVEQQSLVHQWTAQITRLSEKQVALEEEKTRLHQEKRALAAQLQDFRLELTAAENNLRQLQEIRLQISRELELMAQISTQKQALAEAENHLSQLEKTLEALRRTEEDLRRTVSTLTDLVAQLHQAETETSGARETDRLPGSWDELIRQYRQLLDTASRELAELRHRLQEKHSRRSDYLHELDKRAISEELYAHVVHSDEAERTLRQAAKDLEVRFADAGTRHQQAAEQNGFAKGQLVLAEKDLIPYGAPLDKSDVGGNFEGRLQSLQDTRKQVLHQQRIHAKLESKMSHTLERLSDRLQGCVRPEPIASVVLENDFTTQCTTATGELEQCKKQLAASEKLVSDELRVLRQQFQDTACGVLDSVVSMAELLEKKLRGDRYFTLTDLIDSSISNAQRAISQIMTDLREFEHHHHDLIHQCTLQGQRIYEGLKQMSASSRVTVYDGKPKKTMIRFDLPETVDPEAAAAAITDEIDKGTRELVAAMSNSSEQEIVNLAKRIVSSRNLVRKYLRQESIQVHAFKIDQNPQNAGYRSWKQTQVNNSGAEKFIVYFAVILSLMSYTREELGGIRDKELRSVLILDNPFGATSSRHILEPMFAIARHFRVQMVCLSDINKSDVINCFDIVIKAIVKKRAMSSSELLTHEVNEVIDHGFYRAEQLSLL